MKRLWPLIFLLAACATPRVAVNRTHDFSKTRRVAVAAFAGPSGAAAADALAQELLSAGLDVVERSQLEKVIAEQRLSTSGLLDPETIGRLGRLLGVDAIVFGTVTSVEAPRSFIVAVPGDGAAFGPPAAEIGRGTVYSRGSVAGMQGTVLLASAAAASVNARLVDVETGSLLWSASQSWEGYDVQTVLSAISQNFAASLPLTPRR